MPIPTDRCVTAAGLVAALLLVGCGAGGPVSAPQTPSAVPPELTATTEAPAPADDTPSPETAEPSTAEPPVTAGAPTATPGVSIHSGIVASLQPLHSLELAYSQNRSDNVIVDVAFSPGGDRLLVGLFGNPVVVVDTVTWQEITRLEEAGGYVAWSPDGTQFATSTDVGVVTLWDSASLEPLNTFNTAGHFGGWSASGALLAFDMDTPGDVGIWDVASQTSIATLPGVLAHDVEWSPAGDRLVIGAHGLFFWDLTGGLQHETSVTSEIYTVAWSPDGAQIALGQSDGRIQLWDAAAGERTAYLDAYDVGIFSLDWSPDGSLLASVTSNGDLAIWSMSSSEQVFTAQQMQTWDVDWSPAMHWLATGENDGTLVVWGVEP